MMTCPSLAVSVSMLPLTTYVKVLVEAWKPGSGWVAMLLLAAAPVQPLVAMVCAVDELVSVEPLVCHVPVTVIVLVQPFIELVTFATAMNVLSEL